VILRCEEEGGAVRRYWAIAGRVVGISWVTLIGGATCAIVLYVAFALLRPSGDPWVSAGCDRGSEIPAVVSPTGSLVARGIYLQCGGPMANTAANYVVIVRPGHEPTRDDEVFSGDWGYINEVSISWKDDQLLQITLPNDALIYDQREKLGDVAVEVKFKSDDPLVREAALRERQQRVKTAVGR
jgi:hypothetical protein